MSEIQSVRFKKESWTQNKARQWLKKHDFYPIKEVDITKNWYRYRIEDPKEFDSFITKKEPNGIELVIGFY